MSLRDSPTLLSDPSRCGGVASARADRRTTAPRSTFWYGFWLAVVLVTTKWLAWRPLTYLRWMPSKTPFRDFCVVTNADVIFALLSALTFQAVLQLTSGRRRLHRVTWGTWVAFCIACVFYAVLSIRIFGELRAPLTYPLISLSRNVK